MEILKKVCWLFVGVMSLVGLSVSIVLIGLLENNSLHQFYSGFLFVFCFLLATVSFTMVIDDGMPGGIF
ncbi:MAG: hypothetical protein AABW67_03955 [Nanoarchaeota archaeon]